MIGQPGVRLSKTCEITGEEAIDQLHSLRDVERFVNSDARPFETVRVVPRRVELQTDEDCGEYGHNCRAECRTASNLRESTNHDTAERQLNNSKVWLAGARRIRINFSEAALMLDAVLV
jgi:hypothetical protein